LKLTETFGGSKNGAADRNGNGGGLARRLRWPLMIGGPALILAIVAWFVITGSRYQSTDDAYVQAPRTPVSASVNGRVVEVDVKENQHVQAGQLLFKLDPQPFATAVEQAEAELAAARLQVASQRAAYGQQLANARAARATVDFSAREAARQKSLFDAGVASRDTYDQSVHAADQARAMGSAADQAAAAALANLGGSVSGPVDAHPTVMQAKAALDRAKLNLSYTVVLAPAAGVVTKVDQLPVGTYVNASQPLFWLVSGQRWIEANFKENQLARIRIGQQAEIRIDAYPGKVFTAHVASFSPGTGSSFSILPAQNATGNWVKVVQRLPVQLAFDQAPPEMAENAGLSARVKVDTGAKRQSR
jgi:membrane fusion protein (multidrug efflux system)